MYLQRSHCLLSSHVCYSCCSFPLSLCSLDSAFKLTNSFYYCCYSLPVLEEPLAVAAHHNAGSYCRQGGCQSPLPAPPRVSITPCSAVAAEAPATPFLQEKPPSSGFYCPQSHLTPELQKQHKAEQHSLKPL